MCNASDKAVRAVLGKRVGKVPHVIYYASSTLDSAQCDYTTTEKEMYAIVFALEKFHPYLLGVKLTVYSDHSALKHLLEKKVDGCYYCKNFNWKLKINMELRT